jgi:hypothetical protein
MVAKLQNVSENVYDLWVQQWRTRHATGDMIVVRYADDTIVGFQNQGMAISGHPPHRSERAQFRHSAPTLRVTRNR